MRPRNKLSDVVLLAGVPAHDADIRYLSRFNAPDAVVCLHARGQVTLVVAAMEAGRAGRQAPQARVLTPAALGLEGAERLQMRHWVAALLRQERICRVMVPSRFPVGIADHLRRGKVQVEVREEPFMPARAVKSAREIAMIATTQRAAAAAMRAACELIRNSRTDRRGQLRLGAQILTSERVRAAIETELRNRDCGGNPPIVAGGRLAADPHEIGSGPLRAGEAIVIDIFPCHQRTGYCGDLTRTVVKGPAPPCLRAMYTAVRAAQETALEHIRAGAGTHVVHRRAAETLAGHGFRTETRNGRLVGFIHGTGHGVGLDIHEAPRLSAHGGRLRAGHVVTVEPGLYYPDIGGIRIEDTVAVCRDGYQLLAGCSKRFVL